MINFLILFDSKFSNWSLPISTMLLHWTIPCAYAVLVTEPAVISSLHRYIRWTCPARSANPLRGNMRHMRNLALLFFLFCKYDNLVKSHSWKLCSYLIGRWFCLQWNSRFWGKFLVLNPSHGTADCEEQFDCDYLVVAFD